MTVEELIDLAANTAGNLAEIVGEATAGPNGNINPFTLPGGYHIVFTGMKVLKHDGSQHHGIGIQPTVPVQRTVQGIAEGRDELLEKAVEVLLQTIKEQPVVLPQTPPFPRDKN